MAIKITEDCINCGLCEMKCPNKAIYEGGKEWTFSLGNDKSMFKKNDGLIVSADEYQKPISDSVFYIVPEKCTECVGFHEEQQCISVCPVDSCIPDIDNQETHEELMFKKERIKVK